MPPKVLLTTIPSDSHNWNLIFMQLLMEEHGFDVMNLGACVPFTLLENTCNRIKPDIVVVSTVNGHGFIEGKELIAGLKKLDVMTGKPVFIGGKLSTDVNMSYLYALELEAAGFKKAYYKDVDLKEFISALKEVSGLAYQAKY